MRGCNGEGLKEAALELEQALRSRGVIMGREDRDGRARGIGGKWRQAVALSSTPSQLLLALRVFHTLMDRRALERALRPMDRKPWLDLLPANLRTDIPDAGQIVRPAKDEAHRLYLTVT